MTGDRWPIRTAALPPWPCCGRRGLHMPACRYGIAPRLKVVTS